MPKFIKFGRFAIAYDDRPRQPKPGPTPPPPSPPPPEDRDARSGWATFGKIMALILGLIVALIFVESTRPAKNVDPAATTQAAADPNSPQGVCERQDVQELASKEARKIMLDPTRDKMLALAMFGLIDPKEMMQRFDAANVTFSAVQGNSADHSLVACSAAMRIDDSDATTGQDIVQMPALVWSVKFANNDGDLTSTNFTVEVDPGSVFEGMQINGKPADEFMRQGNSSETSSQTDQSEVANASTQMDGPAPRDAAAAKNSEASVQDAARAAEEAAREAGKDM